MACIEPFVRDNKVRTYLEFGTGAGHSAHYAKAGGAEVVSVDLKHHLVEPGIWAKDMLPDVDLIVCDDTWLPIRADAKFEMVFIDSSHAYEHTCAEIDIARKLATRFIGFDDITWAGVRAALTKSGLVLSGIGHDIGVFGVG